jgi:hypothetical protein
MQNPQQNPQQVTIKRDYLAVRDKAFDNICKELKASLPTELSLEVVGINYLQLPVAVVKNPKHKMLFFTTYKEIAEIAFAPDITEISEADFELMSAKEKWSPPQNQTRTNRSYLLRPKIRRTTPPSYSPSLNKTQTRTTNTPTKRL